MDTWEELKTAIATWAVRDDLDEFIPDAIALAEREFQRTVFCPEREATTTLSATSGTVALPSDFWGVRTVYVDATTDVPLQQITTSLLHDTYRDITTGTPCDFAIEGENMLLGPAPGSTTSIKLTYWQTIPALGSSQSTNWLLTDHPDVYLSGALGQVHEYLRDYEAATRAYVRTASKIESINRSGRRRMTNSGPLAARARVTDRVLAYLK